MGIFNFSNKRKAFKSDSTFQINTKSRELPKYFYPLNLLQKKISEDVLIELFNSVAEPNAIITYISQVFANVPKKHFKVLGNDKLREIKDSKFINLLENPNQINNGDQMAMNALTYYFVTGNIFIDFIVPTGFDIPSQLYLLPSNRTYPIYKGAIDEYGKLPNGIDFRSLEIKEYNYKSGNKFYHFSPDEILHIKDSAIGDSVKSIIRGSSRLESAIKNIGTLNYMAQTINNLLSNNGAVGFVKRNSKSNESFSSLVDDTIKEAEDRYHANYGTLDGQKTTMFTTADLNYIRTSSPISEFMPIDLQEYEFKTLCKVLGGFPESLLQASETTFTNLNIARKLLYENIVMPFASIYYNSITYKAKERGWIEENEIIAPFYDDIEALQDDLKTSAEAESTHDDLWLKRYDNNLCTLNEMLTAIGLKTQSDGDKYKKEIEQGTNTEDEGQEGEQNQE